MTFKYLLIAALLTVAVKASAQQGSADTAKTVEQKAAATPVKSYISYKTLSQFFQTAVTTGASGGFDFKSSWWGIKKLFNGDPYEKFFSTSTGKFERNFEVSLGVHKNKQGSYSTMTGAIKYSPINNRSKADYNFFTDTAFQKVLLKQHDVLFAANKVYREKYINGVSDTAQKKANRAKIDSAEKKFSKSHKYSDLPDEFNSIMKTLIRSDFGKSISPDSVAKLSQKAYNDAAKKVDMGSLLTFSFNPGYDYNMKRFDTTSFTVSFVTGLWKNTDKPANLDLQGQTLFNHDTLGTVHNLSRFELVAKAGISKTLVNDAKSNPIIEVEGQFEDDNHLNTPLYKNEQNNTITFNAVLTFHLSDQLSLPITLKYDLKKPNLLGIFNLTWNFENSKSTTKD